MFEKHHVKENQQQESESNNTLDSLLDLDPPTPKDAIEVHHIAIQDLYEELVDKERITEVPVMEHSPQPKNFKEDSKLLLKKIIHIKRALI